LLAATWTLSCALAGTGAHAQDVPSAATAATASPVAPAVSVAPAAPTAAFIAKLQASAARYQGRFVSPCQSIAEGLYAQDLIDLSPSGTQVAALYHKAMHTDAACTQASLLMVMHLPPVKWQFDGRTLVDGQLADQVTVTLTEGQVTGTVAKADQVRQTEDRWVLRIGQEELPINKLAEGSVDKDLRQIQKDTLLFGDPEKIGPYGYPSALMQPPFTRISSKKP